jgi:beta-aspartyl-peptidase (threonine type)
MDDGSVDSETALKDPMGAEVTMVRDFLSMPYLAHVVTDTHFSVRDRMGRLIAFVAQTRATDDPQAVGLGVDEDGALCVEADGVGRFFTASSGYAWLVQPDGAPGAKPGHPLDYASIKVTALGTDGEIDLKTMQITRPAFSGTASVKAGRLLDLPARPTQAAP